ncbi:MAG: uroporphyrinogen decarboxylase family protein [Victivallaceae bacterium]
MGLSVKENLIRVVKHDTPSWAPNGMESVITIFSPVIERPESAGKDAFGVEWDLEDGAQGGTYPLHGGHTILDLTAWRKQITIPNIDRIDWSGIKAQADRIDRSQHLVSGFVEMGLFERSYLLLGMEEALMAYITESGLMEEMISAIADYKIALIQKFDDVADLNMVWYGDDWGTQESLFIPPDLWRKIIKPHTKRIYDCMKKRGIIINQHSCGKIESIFSDLVEIGADIWNPCQPCNDLARLKKKYAGEITFCGGIDSQFVLDRPGITPEEVKIEVRKRIDELAEGGGYIAAPSHGVPYNEEIINAMNSEISIYGKNFYNKV